MKRFFVSILFMLIGLCLNAQDDEMFDEGIFETMQEGEEYLDADFAHIEAGSLSNSSSKDAIVNEQSRLWQRQDLFIKERLVGVSLGNETIANVYHFSLFPKAKFDIGSFYGHFGMPLRFRIYDQGFISPRDAIIPRPRDFVSFWDVERIFRHLELGKESDDFFLRLSRIHAMSLSQGSIVKDMSGNWLFDKEYLFAKAHASFNKVRFDGLLGPVPKINIIGLNARIAPLSSTKTVSFIRNTNFDLTYAADFAAPNQPIISENAYELDEERRLVKRHTGTAQALSLSVLSDNYPLSWLSFKPYISSGHLLLTGIRHHSYGTGLHFGNDTAIYFIPDRSDSLLMLKTEGRLFSKYYMPAYFGSTYMLDRINLKDVETKSEYVNSLNDHRFKWGYLFELAYSYKEAFALSFAYENAHPMGSIVNIWPMRRIKALTSFLALEVIKFQLAYEATALKQFKEVFDFNESRGLLSLRTHLKILPFLYFEAWTKHSFGITDMFQTSVENNYDNDSLWLSNLGEVRKLNFGLGLELAMRL